MMDPSPPPASVPAPPERKARWMPFVLLLGMGGIFGLYALPWKQSTESALYCMTALCIVGLVLAYLEDITNGEDGDED